MAKNNPIQNDKWPAGVPARISGYEQPLFSVLDSAAQTYPDKTFTIYSGAKKSYAQVQRTANKVANYLTDCGVKKGDRVAIFLPNIPHFPAVFFGVLKIGAVSVLCNPLYTRYELNYQLKDCGAKAVFCMDHPEFYPTAVKAVQGTDVETVIICGVKSYLPPVKAFFGGLLGKIPKAEDYNPGHVFFDKVIKNASPELPQVDINPDEDLAVLMYTAGTTGKPKGASLTHSNINFVHGVVDEWARIEHEPGSKAEKLRRGGFHCFSGLVPWYHVFGITTCLLYACNTGSKVICIPDPRAGKTLFGDAVEFVEKYKVTLMSAVPTMFVAMTNNKLADSVDTSSLLCSPSGGAALAAEVAKNFESKFGGYILEGYGLSETSGIACINPSDKNHRKFGTVGFPVCNTDVKILDIEKGLTEFPQGEDGEIAISGPQIMKGYWNHPEEDEKVFRLIDNQKYFLTGDIGHIDNEGYVVITDRKKDMILTGGFSVYPAEVEDALFSHPKVALAAVIGEPDLKSGETVKAFIQLKPGEESSEQEILDFCRERLSRYKCPRKVEFRSELPTSIIGKVLRRVLREENAK